LTSSGKKNIWVLIVVVILLLFLISYTGEERLRLTTVEDAFLAVVTPVQDFFASIGRNIQTSFLAIYHYQEIKEENEMLRRRLSEKKNDLVLLDEILQENHRLREMLDFKEQQDLDLVAAEVISRDPSGWFNTVTLNRGYRHGIEAEMAVMAPEGLAGMVTSVSANSSKAILITNPSFAAGAKVQRSRDPGSIGIVEGQEEDQPLLKMINLPPDADIQPGDTIITSGLGGVFPQGMLIGKAKEVDLDQFGLVKSAVIESSVNINRLEEVMVVTSPVSEPEAEENE